MSSLNWFVLRAVSGQEKKIKSYIENEITRQKLNEFVPQILIPSEKIYEMRNGKKRVREKNFFPGYIIISADLSKGEVLHIITSIPGVIGFLGNAEGNSKVPVPLRQSEINRILGKVDEAEQHEEAPSMSFIKGETVNLKAIGFTPQPQAANARDSAIAQSAACGVLHPACRGRNRMHRRCV